MSARQEQQHALVSAEEADRQRLLQRRWPRRGLRQLLLRQALAALATASASEQVSSTSSTSASSAKTARQQQALVSAEEAERQRLLRGRWPPRSLRQLLLWQALAALAKASAPEQVMSMSSTSGSSANAATEQQPVVSAAESGRHRLLQELWLSRPLAPAWVPQERGAQCSRQRLRQGRWLPRPLSVS